MADGDESIASVGDGPDFTGRIRSARQGSLARAAMASNPAKRQLSPAPLPPPKRQHGVFSPSARAIITSFDDALYDELVLFIFSFLGSRDLCAIQAANKNCSRLACDNQVLAHTLPLRETDVEHQRCNSIVVSSGRRSTSETLGKPAFEAAERDFTLG